MPFDEVLTICLGSSPPALFILPVSRVFMPFDSTNHLLRLLTSWIVCITCKFLSLSFDGVLTSHLDHSLQVCLYHVSQLALTLVKQLIIYPDFPLL
jgi:hypothetical protein